MTQTLANRMTTTPDQVFVACNPLQPQEEMLPIDQMAEAHGGVLPFIPPAIAAIVAVANAVGPTVGTAVAIVTAGIILHEYTSEPSEGGCSCDCDCCN